MPRSESDTPAIRSPRRRRIFFGAAALALSLGYWLPAFFDPQATGFGDWQYFHHMWEVAWVAWVRYGEIALYDPFQCGGVPLWGDPQAQTYGPWFLLALALGTTLALKIGVVLHTAAGFVGTYLFARDEHRLSPTASTLASIVFCGSGFFAWHIAGGHSAFLPFYFAPLLAWSLRRAFTDPRHVVLVAGLVALTLHEGGVYPMPYFVLLLLLETFVDRSVRDLPRAVLVLVASGLLSMLLGAFRLIAVAIELRRHPRPTVIDDHLGLDDLATMLTAREHEWGVPGHPYVWPEYCAYVGIAVVLLGAVGYHVAVRRGRTRLAVGTLLFGLLAMGNLGAYAPWVLLHEVPIFGSLRVPSRFVVLFLLYFGLVAALALDAIAARLPKRAALATILPALAVLGIAADITVSTRPIVNRWTNPHLAPLERNAVFEQRPHHVHATSFASLPRLGVGSLGCYVVLDYAVAPGLRIGPGHDAWLTSGRGEAHVVGRTVNTIELAVRADEPVTVLLNQNYSPDYVANYGRIEDANGMLQVALPRGQHRVRLRYRPESLRMAVAPFVFGLLLSVAVLRTKRFQGPNLAST